MYKCKCGREFINDQSYSAHCRFCKIHLGERYNPDIHSTKCLDGHRSGMKGKTNSNYRIPLSDILSNKCYLQSSQLKYRLINEGFKEKYALFGY